MDSKRLERIEDKIDKALDRISSIDVTIAAQHVSLAEHMRRTTLIEQELKPIKTHVILVQSAIAVITFIASMVMAWHKLLK